MNDNTVASITVVFWANSCILGERTLYIPVFVSRHLKLGILWTRFLALFHSSQLSTFCESKMATKHLNEINKPSRPRIVSTAGYTVRFCFCIRMVENVSRFRMVLSQNNTKRGVEYLLSSTPPHNKNITDATFLIFLFLIDYLRMITGNNMLHV